MLASIHPLGERARGSRYAVTMAAHLLGSAAAGSAFGAALGAVGDAVLGAHPWWALVAAVAAALAVDMARRGRALPGPRRQVDEDWLHRYRGWVYGAGYGVQLGVGTVTIVTTAGVYLAWVFALVAGWRGGALVGLAFGGARALVVLTMAGVDDAEALRLAHRRLQRWAPVARHASTLVLASCGIALAVRAAG
jgi:hypothetical protein